MEEIKILLVDDEKEFVTTLAERLQMRDLNLNIALNGEQALKIVKDEIPDVMILDLRMPGIDGIEVLRRVRKAYPEVKVIILTGHGTKKDEEEAKRLGAFDYLKKPVDIYTLIETIKKAYKTKIDRTMVAATFAEAGEFKTAKDILNENLDKKQSKDSQ
ncbi:MAG: response regulator [Candidatus Desulfofervidus auxilii]|nr:response regulator [Candidatus Desulfofervidus auxilii]